MYSDLFVLYVSSRNVFTHLGLIMTKSNNTPLKRTQRDYSLGFKLQTVDAVEKGDMTYKQAQKIYGIQGRSTVLTWLRKHGKMDLTRSPKRTMPTSPKAKKNPVQKIKRLERELDDITDSAFSPKLGVIYQVDDNLSLYGQYVRGFKIPPHDQAYQSHGVEPFYQILPNADLDPESSNSFELGLRYASSDISVNLSAFYAAFDDFIETAVVGVEPTYIPNVNKTLYQYQNISETQISGVEAGIAMYVAENILLEANVAYVDGENKETDQPLTSISPLNGSILLSTELGNINWTAALRLAKSQSDVVLDANDDKTTQGHGYGVVDLYANYEWQAWQLNVGVLNLLDKEYVPFELIAGQSQSADFSQYTQPGRNFSARVSYQF